MGRSELTVEVAVLDAGGATCWPLNYVTHVVLEQGRAAFAALLWHARDEQVAGFRTTINREETT